MDTAREKRTLELVEAEELWSINAVDRDGYICRGCVTQVFPASYDKNRNKKRPYFSLGPVNKHETGCDVDGEEKIVKRASKERLGNSEGFPLPYPNRLTFTDERLVTSGGIDSLKEGAEERTRSRTSNEIEPRRHHGHTVKSIRPVCRAFINFPYDREGLPLAIPNIPGDTYAKVFWYVGSKKPEHFRLPTHLYYAAIRWKAAPELTEKHCELTLNAGEWDDKENGFKSLCRIRVNWMDWSQARKNSLMKEFETTREEAIEAAKLDSQIKGWIFFVGTQDAADPTLFHVDKYRFICCLAAKLVWPNKK